MIWIYYIFYLKIWAKNYSEIQLQTLIIKIKINTAF